MAEPRVLVKEILFIAVCAFSCAVIATILALISSYLTVPL